MDDTRVSCFDCRDIGRCNAPIRAHPELLRRCEAFAPKRDAADQRTGAQRYPELIAECAEAVKTRAQTGIRQAKQAIGKTV